MARVKPPRRRPQAEGTSYRGARRDRATAAPPRGPREGAILRGRARQRVRTALAWHPEWPLALVALAAWAALLGTHQALTGSGTADPQTVAFFCALGSGASVSGIRTPPGDALSGWALMSTAMMVPAALPAARFVALNSIRQRRARAMGAFASAYLTPWLLIGSVLIIVLTPSVQAAGPDTVAAVLLAAAVWQLTRWKRRAVLGCPRTVSLPPSGLRADAACARFGWRYALRCVVSTWPLMLLMLLVGHRSTALMAALTGLMVAELHVPVARAVLRPVSLVLGAAAGVVVLLDRL